MRVSACLEVENLQLALSQARPSKNSRILELSLISFTHELGVGLELDRDVVLGLCKAAAHLERPGAGSQYDLIVLVLGCRYPG